MALVLSLREEEPFFIGDRLARITNVRTSYDFDIVVAGGSPRAVTDRYSTEIVDDVFVSAGAGTRHGLLRVAFEAPRHVRIVRAEREPSHAE